MAVAVNVADVGLDRVIIEVTDVENTVDRSSKDLRNGPATVYSLELDNSFVNDGTAGTKNWIKLYDDISTALVAGTSPPVFIIPVALSLTGDGVAEVGFELMECPDGMPFENGISILASQQGGDDMSLKPGAAMDVRMLTS